eukprot:m.44739 g.44739  ORF g.44739 m.44739 type:complete len:308 (-) comp19764_c0_seq2:217-1140(-)
MGLYECSVFCVTTLFVCGVLYWVNLPKQNFNLDHRTPVRLKKRQTLTKAQERVAVTTICVDDATGSANLYRDITMANHKAFSATHGYDYFPVTEPLEHLKGTNLSDVRWHKSFVVQDLLLRYDWVFWSDCDAMFMNFSLPLPIPRATPSSGSAVPHMIVIGDNYQAINSGQFLIDNSQWSLNILSQIPSARVPWNRDRKHNCGNAGKDNPVFNWVLWRNCTVSSGSGASLTACQAQVNRSLFPNQLGCSEFNTYPRSYANMSPEKRTTVFRVHFPGNQLDKVKFVNAFKGLVSTDGSPSSAELVWPI